MDTYSTSITTIAGVTLNVTHSFKPYNKSGKTKVTACVAGPSKPETTTITVDSDADMVVAVAQADNRLLAKLNARCAEELPTPKPLCELYDERLAPSIGRAPNDPWYFICPPDWRSPSTKELRLKYFRRHYLPMLSDAVEKNAYGPTVDEEIRTHILSEVTENISRNDPELSEDELSTHAKNRANVHIVNCNVLYAAFRLTLKDHLRYPQVQIPLYDVPRSPKPEQCKALDWEVLVALAALLRLCLSITPLALGGMMMMSSMLRTAEATAPQFGDIVIRGNYAVYGVLWQSDGSVRIADLKSDSAYRLVVIPKYTLDGILERKAELLAKGIPEKEVKRAYVVSAPDDPFRPADPNELSAFVRRLLGEIGCDEAFWQDAAELMHKEPEHLPNGKPLGDLLCYVLRRSGCTYLSNCSGLDPRVVDVIMGHLLRREDMPFASEVTREEIWAVIADHMECIVLDPDHSAHPAFSPRDMVPVSADKVIRATAHTCFQLRVTEEMLKGETVDLLVSTLECVDIEIGLPEHAEIRSTDTTPNVSPGDYPCIAERLTTEEFNRLKARAKEIFERIYPQ